MSRVARAVTVRASAKINLHLGVGAARADGFHPLDTVYQAIGLHDDLTVVAGTSGRIEVEVASYIDDAGVPRGGGNIIDAASLALARHHMRPVLADYTLRKTIPVAGGMAGGSADAAAALVALDRLHDLNTSDADLLALAAELGSDVPFALIGGSAHGTGRGELVRPLVDRGTWWWVVVPNREGLSTPAVYRHFDVLHPDASPTPPSAVPVIEALASGSPLKLGRALRNDLQEPALDLRPELGALLSRGEMAGALRGLVSGSGPSCIFLCDSAEAARAVADDLRAHHDVVLIATGAVAGAHVLP